MCLYVYFTTNFMDDMVNITTGDHTHFFNLYIDGMR